jgi:hypothetical protein
MDHGGNGQHKIVETRWRKAGEGSDGKCGEQVKQEIQEL